MITVYIIVQLQSSCTQC